MINSNYHGFDALNEHPTTNQVSRAANLTYTSLQFRGMVDRQKVSPFSISPRTKVHLALFDFRGPLRKQRSVQKIAVP
ncbi:unnamed protein product [Caenorhabditis brenneri]